MRRFRLRVLEVTRVTKKNFVAIEEYMHANKLKVNRDKIHLFVVTNSNGGVKHAREAAERRAAVSLVAGGEMIQESESELLLGATVHNSGRRNSITAVPAEEQGKRPQEDLHPRGLQDKEDGGWRNSDL